MPPATSRKRLRSSSPAPSPPTKSKGKGKAAASKSTKPTLFDVVDVPAKRKTLAENKKLLEELNDDDEDGSLSEADSDEFEDVPAAKRRKTLPTAEADGDAEEDEEEGMDWEDAIQHSSSARPTASTSAARPEQEIADISFTIHEDGSYVDPGVSIPGLGKKGPSKRERVVRVQTHCLHIQALLWHNTVRNSWLNDKEVQKTLVDGLTEGVRREVTRWKESMGTLSKEELEAKKKATAAKGKGKRGKKGKKKGGRDWNYEAEHLEQGVPNLSAGDPLLRLLKVLTAYWRKRFTITAPGLRKQGYMSMRRLGEEVKSWQKNQNDAEHHGERIESLSQLRKLAHECEGSRDVGAQLFAALLRGLGMETRMVVNLQPAGLGWSKSEEADAKKPKKKCGVSTEAATIGSDSEAEVEIKPESSRSGKKLQGGKPARKSARGNKSEPISLEDSDSALSSAPSDAEPVEIEDDDDLSVVDVTPATPKKKPNKKYDRDLGFPIYWVEVCSAVSNKYIPVDPIVLSTIASNDDLLQTFEPRGKKAEQSRQVMAYTVAFSADGTAKDVTVRYLKKHQLPGKTKGMRVPVEKMPVYNRKGKVKKYEEYDWFRTVMSLYDRPEAKRTAADEREEETDLKPFKPAKEEKEVEKESLQWYKQSAEYVLEQHLRREEAVIPGAKAVKTFTAGKGDKAKEHPVFRRKDVVACKTVESWHKEGRAIKMSEQPMKLVPTRAVTLIRKREMEDVLRETGEKLKQGLYAIDQTDWIIPAPIKAGVIPKNAYGNMDVYVPTMVPQGAVHLPLKGSAKLCRRLEIDYAEACTGFEFGKQRAVPVLTGVVVADEHELLVRDAWRAEQKEIKRKEDTKRTAAALHLWRKMLLGLRVLERMRVEYADAGGNGEEVNPFVLKARRQGKGGEAVHAAVGASASAEEDMGGGFFPPGHDEEEVPQRFGHAQKGGDGEESVDGGGGGFLVEDGMNDMGGGFLVDEDADGAKKSGNDLAPITPVSLQSMHKAADGADDKDDVEMADAPMKSVARKTTSNRAPEPKANKPKRKAQAPPSEDEADESSLSELDDASEEARASSNSDSDVFLVEKALEKRSSPQVVVTPPSRRRGGKKATPLKSQYFANSDSEQDDEDGDQSTEAEVVKPRKTTARTRAKNMKSAKM
ncbi:hypothetical protein LTR36_010093 [Oleoguttula mirabilis]|uniref:Xeroderma pigmentosum group C-complementing protein n=1 Tax=Oleoguttula mirabilis TaxID=1507867 RepID=A0AAV9JRI1_9PEZI|nr:hypothetical protein LTR36_010093 [Oleoguttula mirabilis]